jgi:hypothetical protein
MASADVVDLVASPLRVLRAVKRDQQVPASPEIGLAVPWLYTACKGSPSLLQEIRRELASSDQVVRKLGSLRLVGHIEDATDGANDAKPTSDR